jgi:two-component system, OmpR family, phosphate regulon sensor histidine kinase PhoR
MIIVTAVSFGFVIHSWEGILRTEIERGLTQKAQMFASEVNDHTRSIGALTSQEGQRAGARATVVDMNGKVIADSEVRVGDLQNEGRRPEFAAALHGDTGSDVRSRNTFGIPVLYVAVPVSGGAVRLAYPLADVSIATARGTRVLVFSCIVAVLAAFVVSALTAAAVTQRPLSG